jgi:hypothetical protein
MNIADPHLTNHFQNFQQYLVLSLMPIKEFIHALKEDHLFLQGSFLKDFFHLTGFLFTGVNRLLSDFSWCLHLEPTFGALH